MTTQNWPQDPLVPSTTGNESSTADLGTPHLDTGDTGTGAGTSSSDSKKDAAKGEAKKVGEDGKHAAKNVADTATTEAKSVAAEATDQAKDLFSTVSSEVKSQAGAQQEKITEGIRGVSDELKSMAEGSDNPTVSNLVRQASQRTDSVASWLEGSDASDLLEDVKSYARRKPGMFLLLAGGAGVLVGRLTRGVTGNRDSHKSSRSEQSGRSRSTADASRTSEYAGYTEVDSEAYSGTPATAGVGGTMQNSSVESNPAFVDPADDYPTIPPGTPPVGIRPNDGGLR
ncbi:hypothetical protein E8P82_01825 [Arthrobacter echini]|uniref:Uncharacterized protein n=1 Tax=Arthrobacter echini TaxID=1529066 RepID=A0A4S5EAF7_9MICC|nr:hypothetical protein [Arthrobacter echini]THJ68664.1 hypothetical protein E8P82_01825 [Arthrobacter echini]